MAKSRKTPSLFDAPDTESATPPPPPGGSTEGVALHEAAQSRYLNYALSVITSRALPDVRDGLKPVQRRILFSMWQKNLTADAKHRKCATVVGDVMGSYHPHGDAALYEALVRMAQPFSLRYPLVDGSGNFGSLDGDSAAAMRYTECRLTRISNEILAELDQDTVPFRPNYDGTKTEPVVLPARIPNLLINGTTGIAVGMATNVPPHNLAEVCAALIKLLDNPDLSSVQLCRWVKGPDFPTGAQILNTPDELKEIYRTGSGTIRLRSTWEEGPETRAAKTIYVTSIPYAVNKSALVERIADVVLSRKLPPLVDVKDVSTDDVRIALELKKDADPRMVMAYLFKNTPLQTNVIVNLTCLIPTENAEVGRPERLDLKAILWHFLHFRLEVVTNRLEHELESLRKRIHVLEGFEKVFDALDEIIRIIRKSDGKADSAEKIMKRFELDAEQTDAILELKLYRLARLEILVIQNELARQAEARAADQRPAEGRGGPLEGGPRGDRGVQEKYGKGDKRRTLIESEDEVAFSADDFIVEEDNVVIVSRDGWVKRQKEVRDLATTRLREGDSVLAVLPGSTRATVTVLLELRRRLHGAHHRRPASTGYGEPIQKLFKLRDGERVIAAFSLDPRAAGDIKTRKEGEPPPVHALAVTSDGYALRFSFEPFVEASTRPGAGSRGRRMASRWSGWPVTGDEIVIAATAEARGLLCRADEINYLSGPGKGVILIKLDRGGRVLGFIASRGDRDLLRVETSRGAEQTISTAKYEVTGPRRQGPRAAAARPVHAGHPERVENPPP